MEWQKDGRSDRSYLQDPSGYCRGPINSKKLHTCEISIIIFICQKLESVRPVQQKIKTPSPSRIYSFLCKHKLINTNQLGFQSKHSIEHALISLIETIKKYLDDGKALCQVFNDLQKAFDTVHHEMFLEKLKHYGTGSKQNDWFRFFLSSRK